MGFEPFYDYSKITGDAARDFVVAMREFRIAADEMKSYEGDNEQKMIDMTKAVMKTQKKIEEVGNAVMESLWTVPMMVHLAGKPEMEDNEDPEDGMPSEAKVQRCQRCKSILAYWHEYIAVLTPSGPQQIEESDVPWWEEGTVLAKATGPGGTVGMYEVSPSNRELEKHEMECVGLPHMQ